MFHCSVINFIDRPRITDPPASVTVNENEIATFNCTAAGSGDLTIEWICSDCDCDSPSNEKSDQLFVTSTLEIPGATNLTVTCVVNQRLPSLSSGESNDVEVRLPPTEALRRTAQLIIIPAPTTTTTTEPETTPPETTGSEGKKEINSAAYQKCIAHHQLLAHA